ncbi:hypothetical protein FSP39_024355 [Pinctada imbricata]|uniref:OAR domain-containing protein n=1 Tax=Pinctada imbricata TaxID=66713 RepID=A0AA88Y1A5_PINIB|nr:hypothetical protein FSP39_024355 [Pinctada imbricata]
MMLNKPPYFQPSFVQTLLALNSNAVNRHSMMPFMEGSSYKSYLENIFGAPRHFLSQMTHPAFKSCLPFCGCCPSRPGVPPVVLPSDQRTSSVAELRRRAREHLEAMTSPPHSDQSAPRSLP